MNTSNDFLSTEVQNKLTEYYFTLKELKGISKVYELSPTPELGEQLYQIDKQLGPIEDYLKKNFPIKNTNVGYLVKDGINYFMFKVGVFESKDGYNTPHSSDQNGKLLS